MILQVFPEKLKTVHESEHFKLHIFYEKKNHFSMIYGTFLSPQFRKGSYDMVSQIT